MSSAAEVAGLYFQEKKKRRKDHISRKSWNKARQCSAKGGST
jgi:hypothetical protein